MLGGVWARAWPLLTQLFGDTMYVYKDVWKPAIGEKLHSEQERDNVVDKFAMKVVKNSERFLVCGCLVVSIKLKLIA